MTISQPLFRIEQAVFVTVPLRLTHVLHYVLIYETAIGQKGKYTLYGQKHWDTYNVTLQGLL